MFARRRLWANEVVGEIRGQIVELVGYGSEYCIDLGDGRVLEPDSPFRFVNHSCEPNCEYFYYEGEDPDRLFLHALVTIERGAELTIDYGWPADVAIRCLCGKATCRGWIVHPDELARLPLVGKNGSTPKKTGLKRKRGKK